MNKIDDITPEHLPVTLLRDEDIIEASLSAKAMAIIWLDKEDELYYEMCAIEKKDLLWALKCMENNLMRKKDE